MDGYRRRGSDKMGRIILDVGCLVAIALVAFVVIAIVAAIL
jgi:hypothetical protein